MASTRTSNGASASATAFAIAAGGAIAPPSPTPLMPWGVCGDGLFNMTDLHLRHVNGGWDKIIHQRPRQELAVLIVESVFVQGRADSLSHATLNLTIDDCGVDNRAAVFNHNIAQQGHLAGVAVHFDQGDMGRVSMRGRWRFVMGRSVQTRALRPAGDCRPAPAPDGQAP